MKPEFVLLIGGPTGSGKNRVAIEVSRKYECEIVNADSRQIYKGLAIGTNQPSLEERREIPHHLYGFLNPEIPFSAADYERVAVPIVEDVLARNRMPVVTGGTGFYLKAFLKGTWPVPAADRKLRERLHDIERRRGREFLHRMLERIDPASASRIDVNDVYRVTRSLEIYFQTGRPRSLLVASTSDRYAALKFCLDPARDVLEASIRTRTQNLFEQGWIEEVRELRKQYPAFEEMPAAASLGYRLIVRYLRGGISLEDCREEVVRQTLQYAKRQRTWFRNQDQFMIVSTAEELHKKLVSVLQ